MKNILVTGGAGYIGSHVVKLLGELGYKITIIDNLSTGREGSILYGDHFNFDIGDDEKLDSLFKERTFDACFHFAGSIVVPESVTNPIKYYENNTVNTFKLLKMCRKFNINKFIFSSTAAVYGDALDGICSEDTTIKPLNPYGKTKYMTEAMLQDFSVAYSEFNYVALRYFNVAGASVDGLIGQCGQESTHLIKIASELATGKRDKMYIFGEDYSTPDGTCVRDYIHVEDLASAHIKSYEYLLKNNTSQVMNCGYGQGYSVKEVLTTIEKVINRKLKIESGPRREGDAATLVSQANKISEILGWIPSYNNLELICKTAVDWEEKLKILDNIDSTKP
jgi:UDP-glucose 4-epimerase